MAVYVEPLAVGQLRDESAVGVGVIVVMALACVMVVGRLLVLVVGASLNRELGKDNFNTGTLRVEHESLPG